ncbi:methyl-accepting chemotaxis protein [Kineococcus rubinsiae]|uniref:methyl-accepting chemotaxis protein n=1 Tax=Kineococcus rubinsiae TaxID=2609562 RepID=UPI0014319164|nr:methyl-accepting chemotaxis protein [Kineococcus rubinsiae]NIZ92633.1 methyl-accepting chemotaxis protein [Kineococcus rubinsiae]
MSSSTTPAPQRAGRRTFGDLGVQTKILAAIVLAALVSVVVGLVGLDALAASDRAASSMYEDSFVGLDDAAKLRRLTVQMRLDVANHAIAGSPERMRQYEEAIAADQADLEATADLYGARGLAPIRAEALASFRASLAQYETVRDETLLPLSQAGDLEAWLAARDAQAQPLIDSMMADLTTMVDREKQVAAASAAATHAGYVRSRTLIAVVQVVGLLAAVGAGLLIARRIVAGLRRVQHVAEGLEGGDLTRTAALDSRDEVGRTAASLDAAVGRLSELVRTIDGASSGVATAAQQMSAISTQIAAGAEETSAQAAAVAQAADVVSAAVQTVAAGSEEMGASIREISGGTNEAARVAAEAVTVAETTTATITALGDSSREIGAVVATITAIAAQTNLLALNATIEAARAGDAGKGFAVVAGEVKELAQQTARATEDISSRVQSIQGDSAGAVLAIEEISSIIARINDFQLTISSAVEEQTATTSEMNRNVSAVAESTGDIATNISGVADAASGTAQAVTESQQATSDLARTSVELSALVAQFRY